ncbi:SRPBCC domain-containing protein [Micromonospora sp. NPDC049679]|uniref:SRPBCC domain-containing protein n=1 Tax=Micromonospora sp. NPDC049679 TaxID=3155920 RepID=UPI0033E65EDE
MTEIRMDVEFEHPPERVWRTITDRELLPKWFAESDLEPRAGSVFRLEPINAPGLDLVIEGELISLDEPHRMSMRWHTSELQTLVVWELAQTPAGCRLTMRESCVREQWDPAHRERLQESYRQLFAVRLPAVLDALAYREMNFAATVPGGGARRHRGLLAGAVAVVLAALSMIAVGVMVRPESTEQATAAPVGIPSASATVSPRAASSPAVSATSVPAVTAVAANATPSPSSSRSPQPRPETTTKPPAEAETALLAARYATVTSRLFGYQGEITINNTGRAGAPGWVVTVTLPPGMSTVSTASDASYEQKGRTVTFSGGPIAAGASARFQFDVGGAPLGEKQPAACAVGQQPCAGL